MTRYSLFAFLRPTPRAARILTFVLILATWGAIAHAQTVVDPHTVSFLPSPDHDATTSDGQPILTSYELQFFLVGDPQVVLALNLGKPSPGGDGYITVDFWSLLSSPPLPGEMLESRVAAVGPGGTTPSVTPSNPFMFSACVSLSPASVSVWSAAGTSGVTVTAAATCGWRATSGASWITITGSSTGQGNGTVTFDVAANSATSSRTGTLTVGGQTVTVTQAPGITVSAVSASPASPATVGTSIRWTATATGGVAPLQYKFNLYNQGTGTWTVLQEYSASNQVNWTPSTAGTYMMQAWVRSAGSTASWEAWNSSSAFTVTAPAAPTVSSITPSPASPVTVGTAVTWTAVASGGAAPLEYKFWLYNVGTSTTTVLRDYATGNQVSWTPSVAGTYQVQVGVRSAGSTASYDAWLASSNFTVNGPSAPTISSITPSPASPVTVGTAVTWTAVASGGTAPLQYKFWLYNTGTATWTVLQDYATGNQVSWTPSAAGTYQVQIWVRSAGSTAKYDAWLNSASFIVNPSSLPPVTLTSVDAAPASPVKVGTAVTWTAVASGGTAPLQYKFWLYNTGTAAWTVLQDYATGNQVRWTPAAAGTYQMQVWVRSAGSTASYDAWRNSAYFTVNSASTAPAITSISSSPTPPVIVGTPMTWTVAATGGVAPLQYKFYMYNESAAAWTLLQDYATNNQITWTPTTAGTYHLQIWVRSAGSTAAYDAWSNSASFGVVAANGASVLSVYASPVSPAAVGTAITWRAVATGGTLPRQYKFWLYNLDTGASNLLQDYSASNQATWVPTTAGNYQVQVWVRSAGSALAYEALGSSGTYVIR